MGVYFRENLLLKAALRTTQRGPQDMFLYGETVLLTSANLISRERTFIFHNLNNHKTALWSLKFMHIIFTSVYSAAHEKLCSISHTFMLSVHRGIIDICECSLVNEKHKN